MKSFLLALCATTMLILPATAEINVGVEAQKKLDIVIYNSDRALIKDSRTVNMQKGVNEIAFAGISSQIIPESVLMAGTGIRFLENNFNYDVLSYESLLEKSVGDIVTVEYMNPKTGIAEVNQAELLALNGMQPILRINGKIDSSYPGRVLFNKIPANLRAKPTLVMSVESDQTADRELTLNYMSRGLSWNANYVARLNADDTTMSLNGWVSLTNNSGTDYKKANLQVVAGDVNVVRQIMPRMLKANMAMDAAMVETAAAMGTESIGDFHLYTLPRQTDILSNQTKQVSLLSADNVGIHKTYLFDNQLKPYDEIKQVKPRVEMTFMNTAENHLGMALPRGIIRMYKEDSRGQMIFVGEDRINHTGNLEEVRLNLGTAFDISADARLIGSTQPAAGVTEKEYEITIKNGSQHNVTVTILENFNGTWRILKESQASEKPTARQAQWTVAVPAGGESKLTYQVQERVPVKHNGRLQ